MATNNSYTPFKMYRLPAVIEITGLSRSSIYNAISAGTFPPGVKIGERAVAWREDDLSDWLAQLPSSKTELNLLK